MVLSRLLPRRPEIVVCGALRSGTNYLRFLLERNFTCRVSYHAYGWKHAGVPILHATTRMRYPDLPILFVVKNPHAFLVSLHHYRCRHDRNMIAPLAWQEFLRRPLVLYDRDRSKSPQLRFANPVQYWNQLYWNLAFLPADRFRVRGLRYEDLLAEPQARASEAAAALGLRRRAGDFLLPQDEVSRMKDRRPSRRNPWTTGRPFDPGYYVRRDYLSHFSARDLDFVAGELDQTLVDHFGYDRRPVG